MNQAFQEPSMNQSNGQAFKQKGDQAQLQNLSFQGQDINDLSFRDNAPTNMLQHQHTGFFNISRQSSQPIQFMNSQNLNFQPQNVDFFGNPVHEVQVESQGQSPAKKNRRGRSKNKNQKSSQAQTTEIQQKTNSKAPLTRKNKNKAKQNSSNNKLNRKVQEQQVQDIESDSESESEDGLTEDQSQMNGPNGASVVLTEQQAEVVKVREFKQQVSNHQQMMFQQMQQQQHFNTMNSPHPHPPPISKRRSIDELVLLPKICDKKNVLKKISFYVKNMIFNSDWITRTHILHQIFALDRESLHIAVNNTAKANLKRRVYDSINVMVASGIIKKVVRIINQKKEYFYKPMVEIKSDIVHDRELIKQTMRDKLMILCQKNEILAQMKSREEELNRIILRNKRVQNSVIELLNIENISSYVSDAKGQAAPKKVLTQNLMELQNQILNQGAQKAPAAQNKITNSQEMIPSISRGASKNFEEQMQEHLALQEQQYDLKTQEGQDSCPIVEFNFETASNLHGSLKSIQPFSMSSNKKRGRPVKAAKGTNAGSKGNLNSQNFLSQEKQAEIQHSSSLQLSSSLKTQNENDRIRCPFYLVAARGQQFSIKKRTPQSLRLSVAQDPKIFADYMVIKKMRY